MHISSFALALVSCAVTYTTVNASPEHGSLLAQNTEQSISPSQPTSLPFLSQDVNEGINSFLDAASTMRLGMVSKLHKEATHEANQRAWLEKRRREKETFKIMQETCDPELYLRVTGSIFSLFGQSVGLSVGRVIPEGADEYGTVEWINEYVFQIERKRQCIQALRKNLNLIADKFDTYELELDRTPTFEEEVVKAIDNLWVEFGKLLATGHRFKRINLQIIDYISAEQYKILQSGNIEELGLASPYDNESTAFADYARNSSITAFFNRYNYYVMHLHNFQNLRRVTTSAYIDDVRAAPLFQLRNLTSVNLPINLVAQYLAHSQLDTLTINTDPFNSTTYPTLSGSLTNLIIKAHNSFNASLVNHLIDYWKQSLVSFSIETDKDNHAIICESLKSLLRDNSQLESLSVSYTNVNDAPIQLNEIMSFGFLSHAKHLTSLSVTMQAPGGADELLRFVSEHQSLTHFSLTIMTDSVNVDFIALYRNIVRAVNASTSINELDIRWNWNGISVFSPAGIVQFIVWESRVLYGGNLTVNGFAIERFDKLLNPIEDGFKLMHPLRIGQSTPHYL